MATTDKRPKAPEAAKPYEPTQSEQAVIDAYLARSRERPSAPRMKIVEKNGSSVVAVDHAVGTIGQLLIMETWNRGLGLLRGHSHPARQCRVARQEGR